MDGHYILSFIPCHLPLNSNIRHILALCLIAVYPLLTPLFPEHRRFTLLYFQISLSNPHHGEEKQRA